jgi:hypothetical protein
VISGLDGTYAWSPDFTTSKQLHHTTEHSDIAVGADGHDVYVSVDYQSNAGSVFMMDIDTGVRTDLFPSYVNGAVTAMHFSGKAFAKPGWVLLSTYAGSVPGQWYSEKLFAMQLAPAPHIYELAFHHSVYNGYWTEPHAAVNRDFTRILFDSNWDSGSDTDIDAYMLQLPAGVFQ